MVVHGVGQVSRFEWRDEYLLGVDAMDDEHKILVNRINDLAGVLSDGTVAKKSEAYQAMAQYTIDHFGREENFLASISYPELEPHKKLHRDLLNKVAEFGEQVKAGSENPVELMNFLNDWLLKHILGVDMRYARFVKAGGKKSLKKSDRLKHAA
jgi:hemerythrin-like metal-binding protein